MTALRQEQYVEMVVGSETYGVKIEEIHEVIRMQPITEIPNAWHYVKGVIHLRGAVVPVISLRGLLGHPEERFTKSTRIVIVRHQQEAAGIIVDRVDKVTTYSDIQPPPVTAGSAGGAGLSGIGLREGRIVGLLRLDRVLLRG